MKNSEQFAGVSERALGILDRGAWGDIEHDIHDVEIGLALLCEATRPWLSDWEDEVSPAFDEEKGIETEEFALTRGQVHDLSDSWRLAYVARLVETLCLQYGLSPTIGAKGPGRSPGGDVTPPAEWANDEAPERFRARGIAKLLHELNDLLDKKRLDAGTRGQSGTLRASRGPRSHVAAHVPAQPCSPLRPSRRCPRFSTRSETRRSCGSHAARRRTARSCG